MTTTDVPTFCRICEPMCGLIATVEDGRLAGLRPDDPHSQGFCCVKGLSMTQNVNDPAALRPGYRPWLSLGWMAVLFRPTFPSPACSRTAIPRPLADWRSSTETARSSDWSVSSEVAQGSAPDDGVTAVRAARARP